MTRITHRPTKALAMAIAVVALIVPATAAALPKVDGHVDLRSPDATNAPQIGAQQEAPGPVDLRSPDARDSARMAQSPPPVETVETPSFDWGDAGIGAGSVLGLLLIMLSVMFAVVHRRNRGMEGPGGPPVTT